MSKPFRLTRLDIDAMYTAAEAKGQIGICVLCEGEHVLCDCGVCFKYCHNDYACDYPDFDPFERDLAGAS